MPAKTPEQRKLFGAALAAKRGAKPISKKVADIAANTSEKELSKMASKPKKVKKENIEGAIDTVYAVQKPYSGCQLTSLVKPIDPLVGLGGSEIMPDHIHGVYHDQEIANAEAEKLYNEHVQYEQALEEKKYKITEKIKKVMKTLEKERAQCNEIIRENPKDSAKQKHRVAELTHKLDELVSTLERVENSKKEIEKKHDKKEKEKVKENLSRYFKGFIKENAQNLNSAEKEVVDLILGDQLKEGSVNPETIMQRIRTLGAKGLLTLGIISTVLTSCGSSLEDWQKQEIKDQIEIKAKELEQKEKQADWDQEMAKLKSSFEKQGSKLDSLQSMKN